MRWIVVAIGVSAGSRVMASFELMLIGNNESVSQRYVHRYDPQNDIVLGRFGLGFISSNIVDIATDQGTGRCFVLQEDGGVRVFDYNTGAFQYQFSVSSNFDEVRYDSALNALAFGAGGGAGLTTTRLHNSVNGATVSTFNGPFMATAAVRRGSTGSMMMWGSGPTGNLAAYQFSAGGGTFTGVSESTTGATTANMMSRAIYSGTNFYGTSFDGMAIGLWRQATNGSGFVGAPSRVGTIPPPAGSGVSLANGHGEMLYAFAGDEIFSFSNVTHTYLGSRNLPFGTGSTLRGMAIVLAPEPSQWVAMGLGCAALGTPRRRRRSRA